MRHLPLGGLLILLFTTLPHAADERLLDALRRADSAAVRALLASGADPNLRDSTGATALMYAALYGSMNDMTLLIDRKADVNAANAAGATALMWAAHDAARVRFLVDHGASVNARTRTDATALIVAARLGNATVMRTLIAHGADLKSDRTALVAAAYSRGSPEVEQVLMNAGVPTRDPAQLTTILGAQAGEHMINVGFTERLLKAGAAPPEHDIKVRAFSAPLLGYAALEYGVPVTRMLLDRGVDPNRRATRGVTPLMMAAAAPEPDPPVVQLLIDRGADLGARDDSGRTALDWALLQGETTTAQLLRKAGGQSMAPPFSGPTPPAAPRAPKGAVEAALARLQPAGPKFVEGARCVSCHHQTLPAIAVALARARGATVDAQLARHPDDAALRLWGPSRDEVLLGRIFGISIGGFVGTAAYALVGFAEEKSPSNLLTDALAIGLAAQQAADGSWNVGDIRPPLFDTSPIHYTALAIGGLQQYMPPGRREEAALRIARGREFLGKAVPRYTQEEAFKLLGLIWSNASGSEIGRQRDRVLALQLADGGWAQRSTMGSDPYQTGQVMYALHASGVPATSTAYKRGVDYLLRSQLEDGTWFVRSRGFAFQQYFETGFPHGTDQFISAAATAWAAIALTYAM